MIRLIAIGCGRVFERHHAPALRAAKGATLAAACEADPGRRAWVAATFGIPCFESISKALGEIDVDSALVATPPAAHADALEACLEQGRSVLVEKPMTVTVGEAQRAVDLQHRTGKVVRVGFNRRFRRCYAMMRDRIRDRGDVEDLQYTLIVDARRWSRGRSELPTPTEILHDAGAHAVDLVTFLSGRAIERIRARTGLVEGTNLIDLDLALEGGRSARCTVGRGSSYSESLRIAIGGRTREIDLSGRSTAQSLIVRANLAVRKLARRPTPTDESFRAQLASFTAACEHSATSEGADARAGLAAVAALAACLKSLGSNGEWCPVPAAAAK